MKRNKFILLALILVFASGVFGVEKYVQAGDESDAIAVRIVPNPEHYGINEWYEKQGFTGSPQALIVDGYEAIRDGRTVYVGVANFKGNSIYTNIYLISYNQSSSDKTVDILGQIIKRWKFNTDLESDTTSSTCSISSISCLNDSDCSIDQNCATSTLGIASGSCQLTTTKKCLLDSDCPDNFFCDSIKAKVIRDLKRMSMVENLNSSLSIYKTLNGVYPKLESGTYLPNYSVSVWPSWSEEFLSELSLKNIKDPINRLGACPGYDSVTCWNKDTKKFVSTTTNNLMLPAGSYGFIYKTDTEGSNYELCSVLETKKLDYAFTPNSPFFSACVENIGFSSGGTLANTAPQLVDLYLTGETGKEFNGSVKVIDAENNPLTWVLDTGANSSWANWSAVPVLKDTNMPNVKKIYASSAGTSGNNITLTVEDGQGGVLSTTTLITIINPKPFIEAGDAVFDANFNNNEIFYSFYISDNDFTSVDNIGRIEIKDPDNTPNDISLGIGNFSLAGENRYKITHKVSLKSGINLLSDSVNNFRISVKDKRGLESIKDIKITIKKPSIYFDLNCPESGRISSPYSCLLGPDNQNGQTFSYSSLTNLPNGLSTTTVSSQVYLSGTSTTIFNGNIGIKKTSSYSVFATSSFPLKINNYCGDGIKQRPNTEGRGGIYNDGYEICDGEEGITTSAASSSPNLQYGCTNGLNNPAPYPILTNSYCVFKSPLDGGGYCGDGYCQVKVGDKRMENGCNCPLDCLGTMSCCGDGICTKKIDGVDAENACNCAQDCLSEMSCCGDGQVTGNEACDPKAAPAVCKDTFSEGLPSYCGMIPVSGTKDCNSTCDGFGECKISPPVAVSKTYNVGCSFGSDYPSDYACCELTSCAKDNCGCCGRAEGASVSSGYTFIGGLSPCPGVYSGGYASNLISGEVQSCKISQNNTNKRNWEISTNHSIAGYRCWK